MLNANRFVNFRLPSERASSQDCNNLDSFPCQSRRISSHNLPLFLLAQISIMLGLAFLTGLSDLSNIDVLNDDSLSKMR